MWEGAQYHSNNAGELTAIIRVLQHMKASGHGSEIIVAPVNLWAADVTSGACGGTMHRRLIREAQKALKDLRESGTEIRWGWAQGHIGLKLLTNSRTAAEGVQKKDLLRKNRTGEREEQH